MLKSAHYAYLQTLTSILSQKLLSEQQFLNLLKLPIEDILALLENKGLERVINKLTEAKLKLLPAGNMDNLFLSVLLDDAQKIIHSLSGLERDYFIYWIRRFELKNIKTILRGKSLQHPVEQIRSELTQVGDFSILPIDNLLHADNIPEILEQLKSTAFSAIAQYSHENYEQNKDVFTIETAINYQYFSGLKKRLKMLDKNEQDHLHPLLGQIIDQTNIIWLLRYRLFYNFSASHCYFLLLSGGHYLNAKKLMQLSQITTLEQIHNLLPNSIRAIVKTAESIHDIEISLEKNIIQLCRSVLAVSPFTLAHTFAYLVLREKQLALIHALLKGKLLQLNNTEIAFAMGEEI